MPNEVHAHQVLDILDQQTAPITINDLRDKLSKSYGTNVVYTNCRGDSFNFEQLINFMTSQQKIVITDGTVRLVKANICDH